MKAWNEVWDERMRRFGTDWEAPCDPDREMSTPIGRTCSFCDEPIEKRDSGVEMPLVGPGEPSTVVYHIECHLRTFVGSVGHQLRLCSCYKPEGLAVDDPPYLSRRRAAALACSIADAQRTLPADEFERLRFRVLCELDSIFARILRMDDDQN